MSIQETSVALEEISEQVIIDYIRERPEFFVDNPDILMSLDIPHISGGAISLIEYQVKVLRERNEKLNSKLKLMINNARNNDRLYERVLHLANRLIDAEELEDVLRTVEESLFENFEANNVAIKLFDSDNKLGSTRFDCVIDRKDPKLSVFENFFKANKPVCGQLRLSQLEFLYGKQAKQVQSTALVPVGKNARYGFVAIGSHDKKRFHPGKDTMFLNQIARLIASSLKGRI